MMVGILKRVSKMPEQRSRFWLLFVIMIVWGIPGLAHAVPHADFTYGQIALYETRFDGSLSSDPAGIARYSWNFGDGSPEISTPVPTAYHVYSKTGTYSVTLLVTSRASPPETGTITKPVTIEEFGPVCTPPECAPCTPVGCYPYTCAPDTYADCSGGCGAQCKYGTLQPYADFTYNILGANVVHYDGSLSFSPEGIASYSWDFGDGTPTTSSTGPLLTHAYSADGIYWVHLGVTNKGDHPKWSGVTKEVTVNWFVCTQPLCDPPGVLTCPTLGCPGGCGVECITPTTTIPLSIGPVLAALTCVVLLSLRRRGG